MMQIKESDWRLLRQLKQVAIDRFCTRVLSEIETVSSDATTTPYERYLKVFDLTRERDIELGRMFNDLTRSKAMAKLLLIRQAGLLTEDEWAGFSEEMRERAKT